MRIRMLLIAGLVSAVVQSADAAQPRGTLVVLNKAEASASLIDLASGRVAATVPTGEAPHEAAASPDGRLVAVSNYGGRDRAGSTLTVIDVSEARPLKTIDLGEPCRPHGLQWFADGKRLVVTAEETRSILIVDVGKGKVVASVPTGQSVSHMVVLSPDGARAFVANIGSGTVSAIDLVKERKIADVATGKGAEGIDVTPDGGEIWVTNRAEDTVSVVDARSLEVKATLPSAAFPIRVRLTPDGAHALVSNARSGDLTVFDVRDRREIRRIGLSPEAAGAEGRLFGDAFGRSSVPIGIVFAPDCSRGYVAHAGADVISVIDPRSWNVVGTLEAGREPDGMAYSSQSVRSAQDAP